MLDERGAEPAISVVIPVLLRRAEPGIPMLRRALESVRDQRFPGPMEVVVVDDGSPRPVAEAQAALGPAGIGVRFLRQTRNMGVTSALNAGLQAARHPLVARLDADDVWRPGKIERQAALFAADPDLTLTATGMVLVSPEGKTLAEHVRPADWEPILDFCVDVGCPFPHGSVLARRDIYLVLGGYPHLACYETCEDFALWSLWLRFFKPRMLREVLYEYTVSPGAVSQRHGDRQRKASDLLRADLRKLALSRTAPAAMAAFADALGLSLVEAGVVAWRMWRFGLAVALPEAAIPPLRAAMPDRDVEVRLSDPAAVEVRDVLAPRPQAGLARGGPIVRARPLA
ncbi:glycosyltransferase family 2 protein [Aquabacter spiritensis]|uniref:Glycosyl transferase family 2 n=1 Tax=Aquabacter spiritensis TaxID=933073 RepID=A0A4R3M1B8_9HYPH|nr:glycosyltransferase family 2 protein [Aquabacter spiritensis]TCT06911.1 glycosyl transferase family 2 [Aquabacter spiritensis]